MRGLFFTLICCCLGYFISQPVHASELTITNVVLNGNPGDSEKPMIEAWLTVSWKNAWRNAKNHDAVWVFFKLNAASADRAKLHGYVKKGSAALIYNYQLGSTDPTFWIPDDGAGLMIFPSTAYRGDISWRIKVQLDVPKIKNLKTDDLVFAFAQGIEMVYVPQGAFYLGESDTLLQRNNAAFYEAFSRDYYQIQSENALKIGSEKGNLHYDNHGESAYRGDMKGELPATFPKGFQAFYCMKYELSDGLYCQFLNFIGEYWSSQRAHFGSKAYQKNRGSIHFENGQYVADAPKRPASYTSWDDECAFADWAGLRPMTELEYEKACRGSQKPKTKGDYPWGTDTRERLSRYYDDSLHLVCHSGLDERNISDHNLDLFGASYYWIMDMNASMWERCVSIGTEKGRSFQGSHGDGHLGGYYGNATNEDWPTAYDGKGGLGYRGGGTYYPGMVGAPMCPVADRIYAAWGDGPRDIAYGFRAVRTAEQVSSVIPATYEQKKALQLSQPSLFQDEIDGNEVLYRSKDVVAFKSISPQMPVHILIVPKKRIATLNDLSKKEDKVVIEMFEVARKLAKDFGIAETGYRLVVNTNEDAGQSVFHIHLHLLGGHKTGPMVDQTWRSRQEHVKKNN
jgi:diadenosine tetraphosphate (Ap4A) HIT family hydrolase/formylglycine-generating enzyme required for sulfatase activity